MCIVHKSARKNFVEINIISNCISTRVESFPLYPRLLLDSDEVSLSRENRKDSDNNFSVVELVSG